MRAPLLIIALNFATSAHAGLWEDATLDTLGSTAEWTNKVELADLNGDGLAEVLFANGGKYSGPGSPEKNRIYLNLGNGKFSDVSETILGPDGDLARVIKAQDLNGDGLADVIVGTTYETHSRIYFQQAGGTWIERSDTHLPPGVASIGDLELGDVDGDGDLDCVLADWGAGNPLKNDGGRTRLWLNNGTGRLIDATEAQMPDVLVKFSWEMELADVDNDWDLDILVSCKSCKGSFLFKNDGLGNFTDASDELPDFSNNYEFEVMDLTGDGLVDLVTINDGPSLTEHVLVNQGGSFVDKTAELWGPADNVGKDDNVAVFLDYDSDGDADVLIGSLNGKDRLLVNDGSGKLTLLDDVLEGKNTTGTLGLAVADLNGDHKLDVVMAQGEVATDERLFWGVDVAPDTAPPVISSVSGVFEEATVLEDTGDNVDSAVLVRARVHDNKSPTRSHDWQAVYVKHDGSETALKWYGEYLWRLRIPTEAGGSFVFSVCARDAAGNETCSDEQTLVLPETPAEPGPEMGMEPGPETEVEPDPVEPSPPAEPAPQAEEPTAEAPTAPDEGDGEHGPDAGAEPTDTTPPAESDGGCSTTPGAADPTALLVVLLGCAGLAIRRRRS